MCNEMRHGGSQGHDYHQRAVTYCSGSSGPHSKGDKRVARSRVSQRWEIGARSRLCSNDRGENNYIF